MSAISQAQPRASGKRQLWIAAGLGLLAAVLIIVFLNKAGNSGSSSSALVQTASVVVAAQPIPSGTKITDGMLDVKAVPLAGLGQDAVKDKTQAVGQTARYPIEKGETLTAARLVDSPKVKAISFQIPPGLRGMTIPVSMTNTPAALIAPGDFVDVIVSADAVLLNGRVASLPGNDQRAAKGAATLLQNVQVISVDRNFANNGVVYDPSVRGTPPDDKDNVSFVTLAVQPDQAESLWLAQENGKLTLVLRAFGDDKLVPLTPKLEPLTLP